MARLNHNPEEYTDGFEAGTYDFVVTDAELVTWRTGNPGCKITIECMKDGVSFNCYENLTLVKAALFKVKEFCDSIGVEFANDDLDTDDFLNKSGTANLVRRDDSKYLSVDNWISKADAEEKTVDVEANAVPF